MILNIRISRNQYNTSPTLNSFQILQLQPKTNLINQPANVHLCANVQIYINKCSAGHRNFFLSPQSANPQPNFNFLNPQPQVRNWTFKSLVRNRKSATTFRDS